MSLTPAQVAAIRKLVEASRKRFTHEELCSDTHTDEDGEDYVCDGCFQYESPDLDALSAAALAVELDVLDKLPTLPSEIEAAT